MESSAGHRKRIEDVRCPDFKGLPDNIALVLHHSFVGIVLMRRSIENTSRVVERSRKAAIGWTCLRV
jgi:hypothetical protein